MTELDPAEAAATLGLAAPAVDDGGDDGLSSDDEPLQSAPVTLGSADIAKLKAVNAGRAAPPRARAIACEYVAYADETWLTTNRDVAHCVPPEALSGGADDPVA
ncbi:sodium solute symporter [Aureococcus anophagefferens]|nr:sodium solute symporter [Aureococcus anophagefferens]